MLAIHEKIQALGSLKADIKFVDAQDSYNGGVIVLVTGSMVSKDDLRRDFTQMFFLAPQDKGYFVLNDIFRYLEDDVHVKQEIGIYPAIPKQEIMAARVRQESASFDLAAEMVGKAFVAQYYTILWELPTLVFRFYQDISKLGRIERSGALSSTTTLAAINEKIQASGSLKADIKFVGAQDSYDGGVIVLVAGSMISKDDSRRAFTQMFFLAPQEKGYFVLNDIFRYLKDDVHVKQENGISPATPSQEETPPVLENHNSEQSNGEVVKEQVEEPFAEVVDEPPSESQVVVESNVNVQDTPTKSFASIGAIEEEAVDSGVMEEEDVEVTGRKRLWSRREQQELI